jgi:hypothetical protein
MVTSGMVAIAFALLGGFFNGTYPVPIKAPAVVAADVHPIIFQMYKTSCVFLSGWIFVLINIFTNKALTFEFSWWAVLSAFSWIPAGLTTIYSVPIIGVSLSIVVNASFGAILSFMVFWLVFGEKIKSHEVDGHTVFFAPGYLFMICLGMVGLVLAPRVKFADTTGTGGDVNSSGKGGDLGGGDGDNGALLLGDAAAERQVTKEDEDEEDGGEGGGGQESGQGLGQRPPGKRYSKAQKLAGTVAALMAGFFSACQYGVVTIGRQVRVRECE